MSDENMSLPGRFAVYGLSGGITIRSMSWVISTLTARKRFVEEPIIMIRIVFGSV